MSDSTFPLKKYCSLREAFNLVGQSIYGRQWQGFEASCDPVKAKRPTDTRSLLRKLAPDGQSFTKERHPDPTRPIDDKDSAKLKQALERHTKTLTVFLRLMHGGILPANFIPDDNATARETINASSWPDPENFDPENPNFSDLWFDIGADRVVVKSSNTSTVPGRVYGDGAVWWAYGGIPGQVEICRKALEEALREYVQSEKREASKQETKARRANIQAIAEEIWRQAHEEGDRLTKQEVAERLLGRDDASTLCRDLKTRDGRTLSEESLVRFIKVPEWLPKRRSRKKDNRSNVR